MDVQGAFNSLSTGDQYVRFGLVVAFVVGILTWRLMKVDSFYPGYEVFGVDKNTLSFSAAKEKYMKDARYLLLEGAKKCRDGFQIVTANGPKIIFPSSHITELKNIKALTLNGFVKKEFFPTIPGFEANKVTTESNVIVDTVRIKLTQSLNPVTIALCEETDSAVHDLYGDAKDWTDFQIPKHANDFVARLSTRVFLGPVVCRNKRWLKIAVDYTIVMIGAARELRMWPAIIQPYVHWFLPQCKELRKVRKEGRKIISEEIDRRKSTPVSKTGDSLGWMQELSHGQNIDLAGGQLGLTFAAIHTTSDLVTKSLFNLCTYPEYQSLLREEIVTILSERGWSKTSLYQMKLLDSFLKETQRVAPASIATINRFAESEVKLSNGSIIPKGAHLTIIQDSMFDSSIYPEPEKFDGHRFLRLRAQPGQENHWQFVTTSPEHTGFGHGMHACPGRFFASNEVKVALCFLLLRYEWRMESPEGMPSTFQYGSEVIANPMMKISYRRRQEELDIMSIVENK